MLSKKWLAKYRQPIVIALSILLIIVSFSAGVMWERRQNANEKSAEVFSESSEEVSSEEEKPVKTSVELLAAGDNLVHMPVILGGRQSDGTYNYDNYFKGIKEDVQNADIAVVNQETILGGASLIYSGYPVFNSPQEMGDALVNTGFDVVLHATNHAMDKGYEGIKKTLDFWKNKHSETVVLGINDSEEAQENIAIIEKNEISIAMLNYTFSLNGIPLPDDQPYLVNTFDKAKMEKDILKAKSVADVVVVFPHWGTEYIYTPDNLQEEYTQFFADLNVDIVIGSHPHVVQPVDWVQRADGEDMLVYYSLGNMLSRQDETPRLLGTLASITIEKEDDEVKVTSAKAIPIVTHYETSNNWNFGVYKLSDYTEEQASVHGMRSLDSNFTVETLRNLAQDVLGDYIQ